MICNYLLSVSQRWTSVNRTNAVRLLGCADKVSCFKLMRTFRHTASLLVTVLLLCAQAVAQTPSAAHSPSGSFRTDPKRAKKAIELGQQAEAAGRLDEALVFYEEAARSAPPDAALIER